MRTLINRTFPGFTLMSLAAFGLAACEENPINQEFVETPELQEGGSMVQTLQAVDQEAGIMAREHGMAVTVKTFFSEDAIQLDDDDEMIDYGIQEIMEDHRKIPEGLSVSWFPMGADVAESGELGYTWGRWTNVYYDENNQMVDTYGKYVTIWRKQDDDTWKVVLDIWNSDLVPASE